LSELIDFDYLFGQIDGYDKYLKVVQVATQSLWTGILEVRAGNKLKHELEPTREFLLQLLAHGERTGKQLPEIDCWWLGEVREAYDRS
jgi:hypothetical protein